MVQIFAGLLQRDKQSDSENFKGFKKIVLMLSQN